MYLYETTDLFLAKIYFLNFLKNLEDQSRKISPRKDLRVTWPKKKKK